MATFKALINKDQVKEDKTFSPGVKHQSFAPNKEEIFWHTLFDLDKKSNVFGQAIVAAAKTYDVDLLANDILGLQIIYADHIYTCNGRPF